MNEDFLNPVVYRSLIILCIITKFGLRSTYFIHGFKWMKQNSVILLYLTTFHVSPSLTVQVMAYSEPVSPEQEAMHVSGAPRKPRILLAASGSVASIKFGNLCHSFSEWAEVRAVATRAALHFIDRASLPKDVILYTDEDEWSSWNKIGDSVLHIELRRWADIMVIAPLSANTLGKVIKI